MENNTKSSKLLITSTGRSGTTFIMLIYIFLDIPSNFTKETYQKELSKFYISNCGLENDYLSKGYVIKNPKFMHLIPEIKKHVNINQIVFPYRDFKESAESRERISKRTFNGGLWNAKNSQEQKLFYDKIYKIFLLDIVRFKIPTIFIDFKQFIYNPYYLYEKLKPTFTKEITFQEFLLAYYQAVDVHQRKLPRNAL
jgi:hypothetical protein